MQTRPRPPRCLVLALPLLLAGCVAEQAIGPAAVVGGASVVLTGRTPVDHVASLITGQDCSVVRLERRESWCAPPPGPPPPQAFCTPSLGRVDCWTVPPPGAARQVADPPSPFPVPVVPAAAAPAVVVPVVPVPPAPASAAPVPAAPVPVAPVPAAPASGAPASGAPAMQPATAPAAPPPRPAGPAARRGDIRT
jgi:hypothetical protein